MKIRANNIDIEVEDSASINPLDADLLKRPVVLLIMGLGMQLVAWPAEMVQALVDCGYRVIRFDNRDIGLSQHFDEMGKPNLLWASIKYKLGLASRPPYTLHDMAADAIGVLDAMDVRQAHVVGLSMGGMIAQRVAIAAPHRTVSLTSIMSSSGARGLPKPDPKVLKVLLSRPASNNPEAVIEHFVTVFTAIGSPDYPMPEHELRAQVSQAVQRSYHPVGTLRQMMAVVSDSTRAAELQRITAPTLVLHGRADPLIPYPCGEDTARRIAGAKMVGIEGMGHDLAHEPVQHMLMEMIPHMNAADARVANSNGSGHGSGDTAA